MRPVERSSAVLTAFCVIAIVLSGCVEQDTDDDPDQENENEAHNRPSLDEAKECIWEYPDGAVPCANRAERVETRPHTADDDTVCVAESAGNSAEAGARLVSHPGQSHHSLEYWTPSDPEPVSGLIAVMDNGTDYHNWDQANGTAEAVLPEIAPGTQIAVLVFRTTLTGSPELPNATIRVDWDLLEGYDAPWPVRVVVAQDAEYHFKPAVPIDDEDVFVYQWRDFMEVQGEDFHWAFRYEPLLRETLVLPEDGSAC